MRKLKDSMNLFGLALLILLMIACGGCGSKTRARNACFPPGSDYANSLYNVNVNMRQIGLDRTEVIVSIYEQGRKPYLKREYEYRVHNTEALRCNINWDTLEDLHILFEVDEYIGCETHERSSVSPPFHVLELHFMYDEEAGTFTEAPNSDAVPYKWNT